MSAALAKATFATLDEKKYPIVMSAAETTAIDLPRITRIISRSEPSIEKLLGDSSIESYPFITEIAETFKKAMNHYVELYEKAKAADLKTIRELDEKLSRESIRKDYIEHNKGIGLMTLFYENPGKETNDLRDRCNRLLEMDCRRNQSTHRRLCMFQIDYLEQDRLSKIKELCTARINTINKILVEIAKDGESDTRLTNEKKILGNLYKALFPIKK